MGAGAIESYLVDANRTVASEGTILWNIQTGTEVGVVLGEAGIGI